MKALLSLIISGALVVSGYTQTRNVLVGTNNAVVQPTNFWSADASNARTGLGLGSAATNDSTAFQPSSTILSNLALSNGSGITNIAITNTVGTLSLGRGGTGATNAADARQNLGSTTVGDAVFIATNAAAARTAIGALATNGNAANLTNFPTVALASNVTGTIAISNGGSGATTAGEARTNLGLGNISTNTYLVTNTAVYIDTNIVATNGTLKSINIQSDYVESPYFFVSDGTNGIVFESSEVKAITRTNLGIGAGATNTVGFGKIQVGANNLIIEEPASPAAIITFPADTDPVVLGAAYWNHGGVRQSLGFSTNLSNFWTSASIAAGRTNLGLPLAALTNTNNADFLAAFFGANTNPVLVNTNGEVVSPTNFWQAAPINTRVQISQPVVNATNSATNARNLFLYSLAISTTGVTNTIQLPTNGGTFLGDVATVIHEGPTSSITAVRQTGAGTNIITLNQFQEAVQFIYESGGWSLADNLSYVEPIYFSGTNAAANAAASRTNLGLGATWLTNTNVTNFRTAIGLGETNSVEFNELRLGGSDQMHIRGAAGNISFYNGIEYENVLLIPSDTDPVEINSQWNNADVRSNLGLGTTNNVTFSNVTASGTLTATSTVTAKTNLIVEGHLDFTTNATNSNPATNNQIQDFIEIRIGTNQFWLPVYK